MFLYFFPEYQVKIISANLESFQEETKGFF